MTRNMFACLFFCRLHCRSVTMDVSVNEMPQMDNKQQTMMWQQQNQYLGDSGIHSGATTQAPSVSSKQGIDDMETDMDTSRMMFDFDQGYGQGFTQEQVEGRGVFCHGFPGIKISFLV